MRKFYYKYLADIKSSTFDEKIRQAIDIIEVQGLWSTDDCLRHENGAVEIVADRFYKKIIKTDKTVYDLFINDMHIHVSDAKNEVIVSIRIKGDEGNWTCPCEETDDFSHPTNRYYEVYVWYIVPVLDVTSATGNMYKHGSWDEYVVKTMAMFTKEITDQTEWSIFNAKFNGRGR